MTTVFRAIGWKASQLEGGYKTWRSHVIAQLDHLPRAFRFRVICGATGSAKTRILQAIGALGEQVLDLETLASHKGSVLGILPGQPQPDQKWFETLLLQALERFDPARPVYVEAESRKIGRLHVPETLIECIRAGECLNIDATLAARVAFLLADYDYFLTMPELLSERLDVLRSLHSRETMTRWQEMIAAADWPALVQRIAGTALRPALPALAGSQFHRLRRPVCKECRPRQWRTHERGKPGGQSRHLSHRRPVSGRHRRPCRTHRSLADGADRLTQRRLRLVRIPFLESNFAQAGGACDGTQFPRAQQEFGIGRLAIGFVAEHEGLVDQDTAAGAAWRRHPPVAAATGNW